MKNKDYILTVCLNPTIQKTLVFKSIKAGEVNRAGAQYLDASGKGINAARVLAMLGENAVHLTQTGGKFRNVFLELAASDGLKVENVESNSEIRFCYTLIDKIDRSTTELVEEAEKVSSGTENNILALFRKLIKDTKALIISGTKAKGFSDSILPQMAKAAKDLGKAVLIDYRGKDLVSSLKYSPDIIKINKDEFVSTFSGSSRAENIRKKMLELNKKYSSIWIITDGKNEILYTNNGRICSYLPKNIVPVNTTGCGDAFAAGFLRSYLLTGSIKRSVIFAENIARRNALNIRPGRLL